MIIYKIKRIQIIAQIIFYFSFVAGMTVATILLEGNKLQHPIMAGTIMAFLLSVRAMFFVIMDFEAFIGIDEKNKLITYERHKKTVNADFKDIICIKQNGFSIFKTYHIYITNCGRLTVDATFEDFDKICSRISNIYLSENRQLTNDIKLNK